MDWRIDPDDQILPPPRRRRSSTALTAAITALVTIAAGMAFLDDRVRAPAGEPAPAAPPPTATGPLPPSAAELPMRQVSADIGETPGSTPAPAAQEPQEKPASDEAAAPEPPERLPAPTVDPANPLQVKAFAAGLHPDLSPTLLAKLTEQDFRNAATAVKTALAETPDNEDYTYPRQAPPASAVFNIRFVLGSPADCRRYIATVTKDRWSHTALPMEKCGAAIRPAPKR